MQVNVAAAPTYLIPPDYCLLSSALIQLCSTHNRRGAAPVLVGLFCDNARQRRAKCRFRVSVTPLTPDSIRRQATTNLY